MIALGSSSESTDLNGLKAKLMVLRDHHVLVVQSANSAVPVTWLSRIVLLGHGMATRADNLVLEIFGFSAQF